jgi:hypothetical protein
MSWDVTFLMQTIFETRWSTKFGVNRTTPVVWVVFPFKFWHWVFTFQATTPQPEPLLIPKQDSNTSFMIPNHLGFYRVDLVKVKFPPFWHPFCWLFLKENGSKWSIWPTTGSFCLIFVAMILSIENSYKNDTNQVSGWWDMREWWWKIGFTPRKIRHWSPSWQHLSLSAISSYLWVLSLIVASWGAHTQFTFQKYPFFRPSSTPSGKVLHVTSQTIPPNFKQATDWPHVILVRK